MAADNEYPDFTYRPELHGYGRNPKPATEVTLELLAARLDLAARREGAALGLEAVAREIMRDTSCLDSFDAHGLAKMLRAYANKYRTGEKSF